MAECANCGKTRLKRTYPVRYRGRVIRVGSECARQFARASSEDLVRSLGPEVAVIGEPVNRGILWSAIKRTPTDYMEKLLATRSEMSSSALGSTYPYQVVDLRNALRDTFALRGVGGWREYKHPDVAPPARAYVGRLMMLEPTVWSGVSGNFGMVAVEDLPASETITLLDPKGTGFVAGVVRGDYPKPFVRHTTLIVGPNEQGEDIVWTFFPGDPIKPSRIAALGNVGRSVTPAEAKQLGFEWVKIGG